MSQYVRTHMWARTICSSLSAYTKRTGTKWDRDQTGRVTRAVRAEEKREQTAHPQRKRISGLLRPFLAYLKSIIYVRPTRLDGGRQTAAAAVQPWRRVCAH